METETKKDRSSILKKSLVALLLILFSIFAIALIIWANEVRTLMSIKEIMPADTENKDGRVYEMTVFGDYYLDDFIEQGGVKSDAELIQFVTQKITKGLFNLSIEESEIGCSSFTATTEEGARLFARNYDMTPTNVAIVHTNPGGNKYKSISSVDLTFLGIDYEKGMDSLGAKINALAAAYTPLDGMNEKGLAVGIYMSYQGPGKDSVSTHQMTEKPDITSTVMLRLMLDTAQNVEEAVAIAKAYDMHDSANSSFHYMVADSSGKSAILEWVGESDARDTEGEKRELKIIYNDDPTSLAESIDYQVVTNFIVYPDYYEDIADQKGRDRYDHLKENLEKVEGVLSGEAAMDLLSQVAQREWKTEGYRGVTTHSVIYNMTEKTIDWVGNEHFGEEAYTLHFDLLK